MPTKELIFRRLNALLDEQRPSIESKFEDVRHQAEADLAFGLASILNGTQGAPAVEVQLAYASPNVQGGIVAEVAVPPGIEPDEYLSAVQDYIGGLFQVEPWAEHS